MEKQNAFEKFFKSAGQALNPLNLILRLLFFVIFGFMAGLPYLIHNLNKINGSGGIMGYLYALVDAAWQAFFIGTSTIWDALIRMQEVFTAPIELGTVIYVSIVLLFGAYCIYQPVALFFNIFDQHAERKYVILPFVVSLLVLVFIIAPISHNLTGGQTITSGLEKQPTEPDVGQAPTNSTNQTMQNNETVNTLSIITGGTNE